MRSLLPMSAVLVVLWSSSSSHAAFAGGTSRYSETALYNFSSPGYGANYVSPLTPDGHGDYFGTTAVGGTGHGTVYELMPDGKGGWNEATLHVFTGGTDGGTPEFVPLILDKNGNLYGITLIGGPNNAGVAYEMRRSGQSWSEHVFYNFDSVGVNPFSFVADSNGDFFGTYNLYHDGGAITEGVFELSPSSKGWTAANIFDDGIPSATSGGGGLTIDAKGNVFGITSLAFNPSEVFELSPSGNAWAAKILYTFPRIDLDPEAPPVLDKMGNIYGATVAGGPANDGTIYELTPTRNGPWTRKTLYAFGRGPSDGEAPYASIAFDGNGDIYGTTQAGGDFRKGTVYELTASGGRYESKLLWSFDGKDGTQPLAPVVLDAGRNVFGTTTRGGPSRECAGLAGCGNAFEVKSTWRPGL